MSVRVFHRRTCRLCGEGQLERVLSLTATPLANAFVTAQELEVPQPIFPLDLYRCAGCGHVQLLDVVDPLELFQRRRSPVGAVPAQAEYAHRFAGDVLRRFAPGWGKLVVGIGSNDGTLLKAFDETGARTQGIEPAIDLARAAIEQSIPTFPGFFSAAIASRLEDEWGRAAVIVSPSVLAHTDDLAGFLEGVQLLLARDGVFVFEVPYLLDIVDKGLFDAVRHEQLSYHAVAPLRRLFHSCDMDLVAVERAGCHGGFLRGFVQHLGGPHAADGSVAALIADERRAGLDQPAAVRGLAARLAGVKKELAAILAALKDEARRIAGFGAGARATTLLYQLGLGPEVLDFVVDDRRWKHGLYTPGLHLPVLPPEALHERGIGAVVILAWDCAEEIIARHAPFRERGGVFVAPLPSPRLI